MYMQEEEEFGHAVIVACHIIVEPALIHALDSKLGGR